MHISRTVRTVSIAVFAIAVASCVDTSDIAGVADGLPTTLVQRVTIEPASITIVAGADAPLDVSLKDADGNDLSDSPVVWVSSDPGVAKVSSSGVVSALKVGTARITASSGATSDTAQVTVRSAPSEPTSPPVVSAGSVGSLYSGYRATSPHWSHIRTLATDFYYHWDATQRAWAGAHFDAALSGSGSAWRSSNAGVKHLPYTLLWTVLTPATGARGNITSVYYDDMRSWYASHPGYRLEDAFLHGSSEKSPSTRLGVKIWDSERWMINPADAGARAYTVDRYRRVAEGEEGVFVDEATSGDILPRVKGGVELTSAQYQTAYTSLLVEVKRALGSRLLMLNTAEYMKDFDRANAVAAGAVHLEMFNNPMLSQMYLRWQWVEALLSRGVSVDLVGPLPAKWADDHASMYPRGNYATSGERLQMWELASYYMMVGQSPEGLFFHMKTPGWDTPFEQLWLKAQEANIGHPVGSRFERSSGTDPVGQAYTVYGREFDRALVLLRAQRGWDKQSYLDATAVSVALPAGESWLPLRADGTLGAAVTSVKLRNSESLILIKKSKIL